MPHGLLAGQDDLGFHGHVYLHRGVFFVLGVGVSVGVFVVFLFGLGVGAGLVFVLLFGFVAGVGFSIVLLLRLGAGVRLGLGFVLLLRRVAGVGFNVVLLFGRVAGVGLGFVLLLRLGIGVGFSITLLLCLGGRVFGVVDGFDVVGVFGSIFRSVFCAFNIFSGFGVVFSIFSDLGGVILLFGRRLLRGRRRIRGGGRVGRLGLLRGLRLFGRGRIARLGVGVFCLRARQNALIAAVAMNVTLHTVLSADERLGVARVAVGVLLVTADRGHGVRGLHQAAHNHQHNQRRQRRRQPAQLLPPLIFLQPPLHRSVEFVLHRYVRLSPLYRIERLMICFEILTSYNFIAM